MSTMAETSMNSTLCTSDYRNETLIECMADAPEFTPEQWAWTTRYVDVFMSVYLPSPRKFDCDENVANR